MQRVLIIGAGGHAQVVADILMCQRDIGQPIEPIGYLDDDPHKRGMIRVGLPILGTLHDLSSVAHDAVVIAIGNNQVRNSIYESLQARGEHFAIACHPSAVIARDVMLEPGTVVCAGVIVNPGATIGANVILNTACSVDHHSTIGAHVHIAPGTRLAGGVRVGIGTLVGIGAAILPQQEIGAWSTIGAGAVVTTHIPDRCVALGVPAHIIDREPERT